MRIDLRSDSADFVTSPIIENRNGDADYRQGRKVRIDSRNGFASLRSSQAKAYISITNEQNNEAFFTSVDNFVEDGIYTGQRIRFERHNWEQLVTDFERIATQVVINPNSKTGRELYLRIQLLWCCVESYVPRFFRECQKRYLKYESH
ncbi:hypothetical protein SCHPADRAFT_244255 [Schizopora paradoxa]|uniref:Uncharacterized protein n=1 Tax=Schizopora paradoxa TaxID=27342 RepID=A0A0H2S1Y5_9AGAM|nr:hypothetical protein SCHPADRAFT_244255 [Schizopora paradoxa]